MLIEIKTASGIPVDGTVKATLTKMNTLNKPYSEVELSPSWLGFLNQPKHKNVHHDGKVCYYETEHVCDVIEVKDLEDAFMRFADPNDGLVIEKSVAPGIAYAVTIYDDYLE
jgi:hypothetical protein